jgi:hypothetical protein
MAMAMAEKQGEMDFGVNKGTRHKALLVLFWVGCVCVCSWAYYMGMWIICVSKLAKCPLPLICLADLAGDHDHGSIFNSNSGVNVNVVRV